MDNDNQRLLDNAYLCFALDVLEKAGFEVDVAKVTHPTGVLHEIVWVNATKHVESGWFNASFRVAQEMKEKRNESQRD